MGCLKRVCFYFRIFPPIRLILTFFKWLFLTKEEWAVLKTAKEMYKTVNLETGCCKDIPYSRLSKLERMYLHRILTDQQRWGSSETHMFIESFRAKLKGAQDEETDGGSNVTQEEFCNAVLHGVREYMQRLVNKMAEEIKKAVDKDAADAGA